MGNIEWNELDNTEEKRKQCDKDGCKRHAVATINLFRIKRNQKFCQEHLTNSVNSCLNNKFSFTVTYYHVSSIEKDLGGLSDQ